MAGEWMINMPVGCGVIYANITIFGIVPDTGSQIIDRSPVGQNSKLFPNAWHRYVSGLGVDFDGSIFSIWKGRKTENISVTVQNLQLIESCQANFVFSGATGITKIFQIGFGWFLTDSNSSTYGEFLTRGISIVGDCHGDKKNWNEFRKAHNVSNIKIGTAVFKTGLSLNKQLHKRYSRKLLVNSSNNTLE